MDNDEIDAKIAELETRIKVLESYHINALPKQSETKQTLYDFLGLPSIKSYYDKALAIVYYLELKQNKSAVTREDVKQGFIDARESPPKNFSDLFYKNLKQGYLIPGNPLEDGTETIKITREGIARIENLIKESKPEVPKEQGESDDKKQPTLG